MPTYDYRCNACGHEFEEFQMMSEAELKKCPECKKNKLERLIGMGAGFLFKGSGYYQTDYRSKSYTDAKKADSAGSSEKPASKPAKKSSDTKPKK
jgi:putative FmdB family regulatory protein